jgi:predicted acyltransferase
MVAHGPDAEFTEEHNYSLQSMNPATWRAMASSLAVARQDRKPLHVAHMHALTLYCIVLGNSWSGKFPTRNVGGRPTARCDG